MEPLSYRHQIEAANKNFDVFPKFFVSRDLSIVMLTSFSSTIFSRTEDYLFLEKIIEHSLRMSALTGNYLSSQAVSNQVLSAYKGLTAVFGMGTGGTP